MISRLTLLMSRMPPLLLLPLVPMTRLPGRWLPALGLAASLLLPAGALAQAAEPGAGFADPRATPPRAPHVELDPVWRPPSIDTLATLRKRGTLRVGVVPVEPMVMRDRRGELVGYSVDLARRMAADIGVEVDFVPTTWADVIPDLLAQRFDLVATGLWATVPRALVVNFSEPTAVEGIHLVASRAKAGSLKTRDDFDQPGVTLSVYAGTVQEALARRLFPKANLLVVNDDDLAPVLAGRAHATLTPGLSPAALLLRAPERLVLPLAAPLATTPAAIAVRKGDPDFLAFINTWLSLQRGEGWLDERALYWSTSSDWLK